MSVYLGFPNSRVELTKYEITDYRYNKFIATLFGRELETKKHERAHYYIVNIFIRHPFRNGWYIGTERIDCEPR